MTQQTAVEWLEQQLKSTYDNEGKLPLAYTLDLVKQAKQMEKEQMIKAYNTYYSQEAFIDGEYLKGEQYFNETYGDKGK